MQNSIQHSDTNPYCDCPACTRDRFQAMHSPLAKSDEKEGKTLVDRSDLDEWCKLLEEVASVLQAQYDRTGIQHDEDLAVICEQTAEYIEGFYLPYDEQGVYIAEAVEAVIGE